MQERCGVWWMCCADERTLLMTERNRKKLSGANINPHSSNQWVDYSCTSINELFKMHFNVCVALLRGGINWEYSEL